MKTTTTFFLAIASLLLASCKEKTLPANQQDNMPGMSAVEHEKMKE